MRKIVFFGLFVFSAQLIFCQYYFGPIKTPNMSLAEVIRTLGADNRNISRAGEYTAYRYGSWIDYDRYIIKNIKVDPSLNHLWECIFTINNQGLNHISYSIELPLNTTSENYFLNLVTVFKNNYGNKYSNNNEYLWMRITDRDIPINLDSVSLISKQEFSEERNALVLIVNIHYSFLN
jgi:hypothetical protein